jgi:hypothetical protein
LEFIFGKASEADVFCRSQGWRPYGRAAWRKPDGTVVYFTSMVEQLAAVESGMTVYVLGRPVKALRVLKKVGAVVVQHEHGVPLS